MSDITTPAVTVATATGLAALLPGIDGNALIGAFAGATLFVVSAKELNLLNRLIYLLISLLMGYLAAPEIVAHTFIHETAVAGFFGGLLCVTIGISLPEKLKDADLLTLLKRK